MRRRGIAIVEWSASSPGLDPIEDLWNNLKDYIEKHNPDSKGYNYPRLRRIFRRHERDRLCELTSMTDRYQVPKGHRKSVQTCIRIGVSQMPSH